MNWLWFGLLAGSIITITLILREHRKMLRTLAQVVQIHENNLNLLIKGENK
jgi:DNA-binding Xre family transcriptional regulator